MRQEVLRRGVLVEATNEVGDCCGEVASRHDWCVQQQFAGGSEDRLRLRRSHPLQHLDLDPAGPAGRRHLVAQHQRPGHVEQVVAGNADTDRLIECRFRQHVEDRLEVGVNGGLGVKRRELPTVQLGFDRLHCQIGALDDPHLDPAARPSMSFERPLSQLAGHPAGVRQIGLQHDPGVEPFERRLVEHETESSHRQVEIAVLLHVEVDELRRIERRRGAVERAQPLGDASHRLVKR